MNMKVICIADFTQAIGQTTGRHYNPKDFPSPKIGEPYTVVGTDTDKDDGALMHILLEMHDFDGLDIVFDARCFVPCSEIDETEMIREYQIAVI
jgi:hypothetical protein